MLTAERPVGPGHQVNGRVVVPWLRVQPELGAVLIRAVEAATLEELVPGNARDRQEQAVGVDALDEVLVTADVIAADEPPYPWINRSFRFYSKGQTVSK